MDTLYSLVKQTGKLQFNNPLSEDEMMRARRLLAGDGGRRNLYCVYRSWRTQITLGGKQRVLGYFKPSRGYEALRFTDMAIWYFWPYRSRTELASPGEGSVNLGLERVMFDMENEQPALSLLTKMKGLFVTLEVLEENPTEARRKLRDEKSAPRITTAALLDKLAQFQAEVTRTNENLGFLGESQQAITSRMAKLVGLIETINKRLEVLETPAKPWPVGASPEHPLYQPGPVRPKTEIVIT